MLPNVSLLIDKGYGSGATHVALERFPFDLNRNSRRDSHGLANQILSSPTGTVGAGDGEGILDGP